MTKSYPDQLASWVRQHERKKRDETLVEFLAVRHDVKAGMDAGYSVKMVWRHMQDSRRVSFGYDTFLKYVQRFFPDSVGRQKRQRSPATTTPARQGALVRKSAASALDGFTFNPDPKKEELL